jgi:hypothetical protein
MSHAHQPTVRIMLTLEHILLLGIQRTPSLVPRRSAWPANAWSRRSSRGEDACDSRKPTEITRIPPRPPSRHLLPVGRRWFHPAARLSSPLTLLTVALSPSTQVPPLSLPPLPRPGLRRTRNSWADSASLVLPRRAGRPSHGVTPRPLHRPPSQTWCARKARRQCPRLDLVPPHPLHLLAPHASWLTPIGGVAPPPSASVRGRPGRSTPQALKENRRAGSSAASPLSSS